MSILPVAEACRWATAAMKGKGFMSPRPDLLLADPAEPQRPEFCGVDGSGSEVRAGKKLYDGLEDHLQNRGRGAGDEWGVEKS